LQHHGFSGAGRQGEGAITGRMFQGYFGQSTWAASFATQGTVAIGAVAANRRHPPFEFDRKIRSAAARRAVYARPI
jgi:hypothetical protein